MLLRDVKVSCSSGQELNVISFASRRVKSKDPIKSDLKCWVTRLLDGTVYFSLRFCVDMLHVRLMRHVLHSAVLA